MNKVLIILKYLVLILGFDICLGEVYGFGMEVVQDFQEDVAGRQFLEASDEEILLLKLGVVPLEQLLF